MTDALDVIKSYLGRILRIRLSDGRLIEGEFECIDREMNFVLSYATEYHGIARG